MKDIKFRVYDKRCQCMIRMDILCLNKKKFEEYGYYNSTVFKYGNNYYSEPMQFTGLYDKNGVEIYEGDIIKVVSNSYSNYISFDNSLCFVEYIEDRCRYVATTGNGYDNRNCFDLNSNAECKVIGNIYENKDLLERKER